MASLPALARQALDRPPGAAALEVDGAWTSWGELAAVARAVSNELPQGSGPVALVTRNRMPSYAALLGILAERRPVEMVYPFQDGSAIARDLAARSVAAAVIGEEDLHPDIVATARMRGFTLIVLTEGAVRRETAGAAPVYGGISDPAITILTSGTTGPPKRFALPFSLIERHILAGSKLAALDQATAATLPPTLLFFPIANISGIYSSLPPLIFGQPAVVLDRFSLESWHRYVVAHRPQHAGLPPSSVQAAIDADFDRADLSSLVAIGVGAAPLDPDVQAAFETRYGVPILVSYGATEFGGPVTAMSLDLRARFGPRTGSVGRALAGCKVRIVDPVTREELRSGEQGLVEVVSPRIGEDWITTADIGLLDTDGFLYLRGRSDSAIIRGGFKILPQAVEDALTQHPSVSEACVVGIPDRRLGELPAAALSIRPGTTAPDEAALREHARSLLPAPHVPVRFIIMDELPRTPSLKTDRRAVARVLSNHGSPGL